MNQGQGQSILVLNRRETKSVELGISDAGLENPKFAQDISLEADLLPFRRMQAGYSIGRSLRGEFEVKPVHLTDIRLALDSTISLGGLKGVLATVGGYKKLAKQIKPHLRGNHSLT